MAKRIRPLLLLLPLLGHTAAVVLDGRTGEPFSGPMKEPRGLYSLDPKLIGGDKVAVLGLPAGGTPTSQWFVWNDKNCVIAIIATKLQPKYQGSKTVLRDAVLPKCTPLKTQGGKEYDVTIVGEGEASYLLELNQKPAFQRLEEMEYLMHMNGFAPDETSILRIDVHFVIKDYYVQIASISGKVADQGFKETDAYKNALKFMAAIRDAKQEK